MGQGWAIGAYDTCNLETTQAIVDAAAADESPAIIMVYPHHNPRAGWPTLVRMIEAEVERVGIPAALVLDHATTLTEIEYALELGFSGVMIDASQAPLEQNIDITRRAVALAHARGATVEAELGHVGQAQDDDSEDQRQEHLTRVNEAVCFVAETGVDALAVAIGTLHGLYRGKPHLDFDRLAQLSTACSIPLVLHGGSDNPDQDLRRAIEIGIAKINVWTDVRIPFLRALKETLNGPVEKVEVSEAMAAARSAACAVVRQKNRLFGSVGKTGLYS